MASKNRDFDGAFFTGVRTTGIYCKPSCPAKLPKPENVTFFATCAAAEIAGFRACLRCRPQLSNQRSIEAELVIKVCDSIENNAEISLEFLARELDISQSHLQRAFKNALGVTIKEFADARRLETFKRAVKQTDVTGAMYESGFGSSRQLYEKSGENLGMTPATYKRGGNGMTINFAIADTNLGKMLVAATNKGVCKIAFGDAAQDLTAALRREFPAAAIAAQADEDLQNYVQTIVAHLDGARKTIDVPLDIKATAFQLRVWSELRKIPRGETRSYKQIAENLGNPKSIRAVARACATNPVAIVNPCHRVIATNGDLSGYAWGIERKKKLLEQEKLNDK